MQKSYNQALINIKGKINGILYKYTYCAEFNAQ